VLRIARRFGVVIRAGVAALAILLAGGSSSAAGLGQSSPRAPAQPAAPGNAHDVTQSGYGAYEVRLAPSSGGFAVAWYDTRDGHPEIYSRLLDRRGEPAGPERRLTDGSGRAYEADIAMLGENMVVGWYEVTGSRASHAMLGLWSRDGRRLWTKPLALPERISRNPVVRTTGRTIFCAWLAENASRDFEVYAAWFDADGNPVEPAQRVGPAGQTTWNLNATVDDHGVAWVAFDARVGTRADELYVARVDRSSSRVTRVTIDDGRASKYPDLAVGDGRVALTWFDERDGNREIYLFVAREEEFVEGVERRAVRMTETTGESMGAYIAWNARRRRFGVAWCDNAEGQYEIYFQSFDERGAAREPVRRLTSNPTDSLTPAITATADGFAIAWNEYASGTPDAHESADGRSEIAFTLVQ
jgi:hypothetical protein